MPSAAGPDTHTSYVKEKILKKLLLVLSALLFSLVFFGCDSAGGAGLVPTDIRGTWSATSSYDCTGTWTFTGGTVGYAESCLGYAPTSWERPVVEVSEADGWMRTENDMYVAWHLEGSYIYVDKTNPGSSGPDPIWSTDWWSNRSPFLKD